MELPPQPQATTATNQVHSASLTPLGCSRLSDCYRASLQATVIPVHRFRISTADSRIRLSPDVLWQAEDCEMNQQVQLPLQQTLDVLVEAFYRLEKLPPQFQELVITVQSARQQVSHAAAF